MSLIDRGRLRVVNLLGSDALPALDASLAEWGWAVWRLDGSGVGDAASLFERAARDLPSPFPVRPVGDFDAFADNLWEAAATSPVGDMALVWTEAQQMLRGGLGDLLEACSVLRRVSRQIADAEPSAGRPKALYSFLVGTGPNFPVG